MVLDSDVKAALCRRCCHVKTWRSQLYVGLHLPKKSAHVVLNVLRLVKMALLALFSHSSLARMFAYSGEINKSLALGAARHSLDPAAGTRRGGE